MHRKAKSCEPLITKVLKRSLKNKKMPLSYERMLTGVRQLVHNCLIYLNTAPSNCQDLRVMVDKLQSILGNTPNGRVNCEDENYNYTMVGMYIRVSILGLIDDIDIMEENHSVTQIREALTVFRTAQPQFGDPDWAAQLMASDESGESATESTHQLSESSDE